MGKKKKTFSQQCAECRAEAAGVFTTSSGRPPQQSRLSYNSAPTAVDSANAMEESTQFDSEEKGLKEKSEFVVVESTSEASVYQAEVSIVGITCSACVSAINNAFEGIPWIKSINVALLTNSATVVFEGKHHADEVVQTIEDAGFEATIERVEEVQRKGAKGKDKLVGESDKWRAEYAIGGMTCSACVGNVTNALKQNDWIESVDVNLISNSGTIVFVGKENLATVTGTIEDAGYDATLDKIENVGESAKEDIHREVFIRIDSMYCQHCPRRVMDALCQSYGASIEFQKEPTLEEPILKIKYLARPPHFTIRHILNTINSSDSALVTSIHHPPTIEDRSKAMQARERKRILFRLALSVSAGVPAFLIGVVCMNLMMQNSSIRRFMMHYMWAGRVSRAEWALFILATLIYFFAADTFHRKALKEVKALWRPGSRTPIIQRFTRFGSMNMLMSLGTTIAYFSSIAELAIAATRSPASSNHDIMMPHAIPPGFGYFDPAYQATRSKHEMEDMDMTASGSNYFDSVIFLTMFLLMGRFIEAYSKAKTGDAVTSLGKLRPTEAILVEEADVTGRNLAIDLLEVGDIILVPNGTSPPFDGVVVDGNAMFDESSLTGESRLVPKDIGDPVFSGTVNKSGPISVRLTSISGSSMLDQIIKIVREGQTRRAPVERAAALITSHFVPFVVGVGILTWTVWLILGLSGVLPKHWVEGQLGGWPLWSLRFAIAVFVIACPCGIGLAAPTALFVGGGMAAKSGILVKGGGEAFQEASALDCIVFDKTGTITSGGDPSVTDYRQVTDDDEREVLGMAKRLEESSVHPVAKAVVAFCQTLPHENIAAYEVQETPGKGMSGQFKLDEGTDHALDVDVIVGNETLMADHGVRIDSASASTLQFWERQGKSVVLVALRASDSSGTGEKAPWTLSALFAVSDPLRPEAAATVKELQDRGIAVWMLSGDNPTTAQAVGEMVGIHKENVIAGVLPDQKADKIQYLQRTLPKPKRRARATVAMVGDGINDSPALTMADVGIAIGSGSDVALSSAEFILIKSDLKALLTLIDLSRTVFRRVWFNFGWALVYNVIAMPVAAGVFYPIRTRDGNHVRLDPVWASLAMALSSVSVICSSLLLRTRLPMVGFKGKHADARSKPT